MILICDATLIVSDPKHRVSVMSIQESHRCGSSRSRFRLEAPASLPGPAARHVQFSLEGYGNDKTF